MSVKRQDVESRILSEYTLDYLGGDFKVVLLDSVTAAFDKSTGEQKISIPDFQGLIKKVATARASHRQKLSGNDIKFLRKSLELKSKELASKLDMSPEHLSRCESGEKVMSANSEKVLRLLVLSELFEVLKQALVNAPEKLDNAVEKINNVTDLIRDIVSDMKINPLTPANEDLIFYFQRREISPSDHSDSDRRSEDGDEKGEWEEEPRLAA